MNCAFRIRRRGTISPSITKGLRSNHQGFQLDLFEYPESLTMKIGRRRSADLDDRVALAMEEYTVASIRDVAVGLSAPYETVRRSVHRIHAEGLIQPKGRIGKCTLYTMTRTRKCG